MYVTIDRFICCVCCMQGAERQPTLPYESVSHGSTSGYGHKNSISNIKRMDDAEHIPFIRARLMAWRLFDSAMNLNIFTAEHLEQLIRRCCFNSSDALALIRLTSKMNGVEPNLACLLSLGELYEVEANDAMVQQVVGVLGTNAKDSAAGMRLKRGKDPFFGRTDLFVSRTFFNLKKSREKKLGRGGEKISHCYLPRSRPSTLRSNPC